MRYLISSLLIIFTMACSSDDLRNHNNPNLIATSVNYKISLDLPQFNSLKYPGGSVVIGNMGIKGIVVYALNSDLYIAHELSDPNHIPSQCSGMIVEGAHAKCTCPNDNNIYNLITGEHVTEKEMYPMLAYRAKRQGNTIHIYN